mmetsp:Transcript_2321/g.3842  ORF Transcript_2321/g.3842 Transcript_2321/m.3842 type:complete len:154 (+) Transcript_2321:113-574(+)|eukprot:CAMPEP_0119103590 /NCGR_PEP_ID=MMETSP1180-20130426/2000_1 /TAXON_ID=3052 ORGANISM="Chlamydomonas cf sp, Strain CCMP681" /NCGR_SAMPLE_ID=MMETSP1180 /ASSEMBLY_ACC=CAM_ASM_000741 /LENGTH=153 /DNA_ID=CAMNT_0007088139 /DNA_START=107 /DNA_END=568 /DNA_ORIENTATION=-
MAAKQAGAKHLTGTVRLVINAASAKPAPPVGPALGQAGLNIMAFCKEFNAKTAGYKDGTPLRVFVRVFSDKTYEWDLKTPPATWFIKQATGLARAAQNPGQEEAATISLKHLHHIAEIKQRDNQEMSVQGMCRCLMRSCRSMGVRVVARPGDA